MWSRTTKSNNITQASIVGNLPVTADVIVDKEQAVGTVDVAQDEDGPKMKNISNNNNQRKKKKLDMQDAKLHLIIKPLIF